MDNTSRIYVAGHTGLVGSAIVRRLRGAGCAQLITQTRANLDLRDQGAVEKFFAAAKPEYVFVAAAKVGGILANSTYPAEFLVDNLRIECNLIDAAFRNGVRKLLFLGSSCIYPRLCPQPIREEYLLTAPLEPTNEWYAIAKIAGVKMAQAYRQQYGFNAISAMPTNLYGQGDNFDPNSSHVLPALLRKFHEARETGAAEVVIWGTGAPRREFMHVDDAADAAVFLMEHYSQAEVINVGTGTDVTIAELAGLIGRIVGYRGRIVFDSTKPDGTPRKLLDVSRLSAIGWRARIGLEEGIAATYQWYRQHLPPSAATAQVTEGPASALP